MISRLNPFKLSFLTGCVSGTLLLFVLLLLNFQIKIAISASLLTLIVTFLINRIAVELFIVRRIRQLCRSIESLRNNQNGSKAVKKIPGSYGIDHLEKEVYRLINEKTLEIDQLKEMEQYRREFLGNVAHELRTPIFTIQGYIHTLMDGAINDPNVSRRFLEKTARNVDNLSILVEDLMTISMIESGRYKLEKTKIDIKELIREVIIYLQDMANHKNISLTIQPDTLEGVYVQADKKKIMQVLTNLVSNSIKYGKEKGQTIIKIYKMQDIVNIDVTDNGEGIDNKHLSRIFERFYRVDPSRSKQQGGTGLGLAIAKHFIEAHNQTLYVKSSPGVGSTFSFTLKSA
jgi:two-component system, OmpR family, phosphate regulon sensor histidine kinase PhoR